MRTIAAILVAGTLLLTSGCGNLSPRDNFSPRQQQEIDNQNGRIGDIESISNGMKAELLKLQQNDEIQNSNLEKVQKGLLNLQSNFANSGVAIFSGSGGLLFGVFVIFSSCVMVMYYRTNAKKSEKTSEILAEKIAEKQDEELEEEVFKAALYSDVEENVYHLMMAKKHEHQFNQYHGME